MSQHQVDQRSRQKDQSRKRIQKVRHRIEVTDPLINLQPFGEQRIVRTQNLDHAARPADTLLHVAAQTLCRQTRSLRNIDVRSVPAVHLHTQ